MWLLNYHTTTPEDEVDSHEVPSTKTVTIPLLLFHLPRLCIQLMWMTERLWVACKRSMI
jgi:hypothetical protein